MEHVHAIHLRLSSSVEAAFHAAATHSITGKGVDASHPAMVFPSMLSMVGNQARIEAILG